MSSALRVPTGRRSKTPICGENNSNALLNRCASPSSGNDFFVAALFRRIQLFNLVEAFQVNHDGFAAGVLGEHAGKARVPHDLVGGVGSAAVDDLGESFVHAVEQDEEFALGVVQVLRFYSVERAAPVNGMDHGPGQREKGHPLALQRQLIVLPYGAAIGEFEAREQHLCLHLDNLVAAGIDNAELKGGDAAIRCNDSMLAVD